MAAFGAADIIKLIGLADGDDIGGIEEVVVGLFSVAAEHLSEDCLASIAAIITGTLQERRDTPP